MDEKTMEQINMYIIDKVVTEDGIEELTRILTKHKCPSNSNFGYNCDEDCIKCWEEHWNKE